VSRDSGRFTRHSEKGRIWVSRAPSPVGGSARQDDDSRIVISSNPVSDPAEVLPFKVAGVGRVLGLS
jgi:hypothetical protein